MVTLHRREDLDDFYNDMETPGGDLYIPDRAVDLQLRRKISRVTNYMLTPEEAEKLKEDPRVRDVEDKELFDLITWETTGYSESGTYKRSRFSSPTADEKNWGIYRHTVGGDIPATDYYKGSIEDVTGEGSDFFKRELTVNGVRIMAAGAVGGASAVPDAWLEKVARMYELFLDPTGTGINETLQRAMIRNLRGLSGTWHEGLPTLQRVARGGGASYNPNFLTDSGVISWNLTNLFDTHVANDMVWYLNSSGTLGDGDTDAGEVIEHVMHTLHMHGLTEDIKLYEYLASDWDSGPLYLAMEEAYDAGKWDPSGYQPPGDSDAWKTDSELFEVAAKEYLYLLNFCMFEYSSLWDGGSLSPEWSDDMRTQVGILANNPLGYYFHNNYIAPVIAKPSLTTIRNLFQDGDTGDPTQAGASNYVATGKNWGSDGDDFATPNDYTITASGKNVDVVIVDGSIVTAAHSHPEFAVNADGTGGSRVQPFNWFSLTNQLGYGSNGTYDYDTVGVAGDSAHGCHVAGTVAGNTKGWARDANIYNIEFYYSGAVNQVVNSSPLTPSTLWDYIREWHNTKPINPDTGRRNPTITNHSYGSIYTKEGLIDNGSYDSLGAMSFRGVLFNAYGDFGRGLSDAELEARGINVPSDGNWRISSYSTSLQSDIEDAIDDGIIAVISSGNHYQKITITGEQDYDNLCYLEQGGTFTATFRSHRGDQTASGDNRTLIVGNLYDERNDRKSPSSVCGNGVDIHAAGSGIVSSVYGTGNVQDSRNSSFYFSKYSGTSMASPQVSGVLALLAESNPGLNQVEANDWLNKNGTDNIMYDTGTDDCTDFQSLQGAPNKILRWINQRPENGLSFPKINLKARPDSGRSWPRPRIRVRG